MAGLADLCTPSLIVSACVLGNCTSTAVQAVQRLAQLERHLLKLVLSANAIFGGLFQSGTGQELGKQRLQLTVNGDTIASVT